MQMQSLFFKKSKANKGKGKTDGSTTQEKSVQALKHKTLNSISNNKKEPLAWAQVLLRGSSKWPAQCVALQKFQSDTCITSRSHCEGSGVMFKSRVLLDEAEEAEVAPLCSVCGSVYSFPVRAGPAQPKKRFLGRV